MFTKEIYIIPAIPVVAINMKADFVVQVKASVSVGFSFEYINAKRYIYYINVFAGQISNDVIDIQEETFELPQAEDVTTSLGDLFKNIKL